jgi:phosphinothricin acetyltransferase
LAKSEITIRPAAAADFDAIAEIYGHHVRTGSASFEESPPEPAELTRRWREILERGLPYLVATSAGDIVGYAYAGPYRARPAYRHSVENSIYVAPGEERRGIGATLLRRVIADCEVLGWVRQMIGIIGDSANEGSIGLHAHLGFHHIGTIRSVGFKHGRWVDTVMMQRPIGLGDDALPDDA